MHKNILLFSALLIFAGCGTKPIVVKAKPEPKPIVKVEKTPAILAEPIEQLPAELNTTAPLGEPIIIDEVLDIDETLNKSNSKSYVTTLKTQQFAFSDAGFMRNEDGVLDLQILAVGKPLLKLKIADDVCVDHHCRTKQEFNMNYLSEHYPDNLINNVLTSQPIMFGQNLKKTTNGFMQRIITDRYDIKYKISPGSIYFKDLHNKIIIKLRELK